MLFPLFFTVWIPAVFPARLFISVWQIFFPISSRFSPPPVPTPHPSPLTPQDMVWRFTVHLSIYEMRKNFWENMYNVTCSVHTLLTVCFLTFKQAQCTCVTVHSKAINKLLYCTYIVQYILLYISNFFASRQILQKISRYEVSWR